MSEAWRSVRKSNPCRRREREATYCNSKEPAGFDIFEAYSRVADFKTLFWQCRNIPERAARNKIKPITNNLTFVVHPEDIPIHFVRVVIYCDVAI